MTFTNFPNGISSFGIPAMGGVPFGPTSKTFFVSGAEGSDGNDGRSPKRALATVAKAHSLMTSGKNDVCFVMGNGQLSGTAHVSSTITWSKHACHLIGVAAPGMVSQRARISPEAGSISGTTVTDVTPVINITGDGCLFQGLHFFQNFSTAAANVCMAITGQRNVFLNCHIAGGGTETAADHAGMRSLTVAGDGGENYWKDCVIGLDTTPRGGAASAEMEFTGATPRNMFEDCIILYRTDAAAHDGVLIGSNGINLWLIFKKCIFWNDVVSGTNMDEHFNLTSPGGYVLLEKCTVMKGTALETVASGFLFKSQEEDTLADVNSI